MSGTASAARHELVTDLGADEVIVTAVERTNAAQAASTAAAGRRFAGVTVEPDGAGLEHPAQLVDRGRLRVHVTQAIALADAAKAHAVLESGVSGKVVLTV